MPDAHPDQDRHQDADEDRDEDADQDADADEPTPTTHRHGDADTTATKTPTPTPTRTATPILTATPTPATTPPLDHFQCYELNREPFVPLTLQLDDVFGAGIVTTGRAKRLCNPADKNGEDPTAPDHVQHLVGYQIRQRSPIFKTVREVEVVNQFGTLFLDVAKPDLLLVPSAKDLTGTPPPLVNPTLDHFKCHRVKRARFRATGIDGRGPVRHAGRRHQEADEPVRRGRPERRGHRRRRRQPALLQGADDAVAAGTSYATIFINNDFGRDHFTITRPTELCVPTTIIGP